MTSDKKTVDSPVKNQRKFRRLTFACQGQLFSGKEFWLCDVINISLKGVKFIKPENWSAQPKDSFRLILSLNKSPMISMSIKIMHFNDKVVGAKWLKIDLDSFNRLKRIMELNTLVRNQTTQELTYLKDFNK
jgi:hypothetical protein